MGSPCSPDFSFRTLPEAAGYRFSDEALPGLTDNMEITGCFQGNKRKGVVSLPFSNLCLGIIRVSLFKALEYFIIRCIIEVEITIVYIFKKFLSGYKAIGYGCVRAKAACILMSRVK